MGRRSAGTSPTPRGGRRWCPGRRLQGGLAFATGWLLAGCSGRAGAPRPASRQGSQILDLWRVLLGAGVVLGVLVTGLVLWAVVRYRRPAGASPGELPVQTRANVPLEVLYTAVPLVIVAVLFALTLRVQDRVTRLSPTPDLRVDVTGFQWGWRFRYPAESVTVVGDSNTPPTLVLPVNATVRLRLASTDVIHSFYVPAFLDKRDVVPGLDNQLDVRTTRLGHFGGYCAEFCGLDHARMVFSVDVVSPEQFQGFVAQQQLRPQPSGTGPDDAGGGEAGRQAMLVPPGAKP
jgi:cytochrome c oxidase subunit 2